MLSLLHTVIHQMTNAWIYFVDVEGSGFFSMVLYPLYWSYILFFWSFILFFWIVFFTRISFGFLRCTVDATLSMTHSVSFLI